MPQTDMLQRRHFSSDIHVQFRAVAGAGHLICEVVDSAVSPGFCVTPKIGLHVYDHRGAVVVSVWGRVDSQIAVGRMWTLVAESLHEVGELDLTWIEIHCDSHISEGVGGMETIAEVKHIGVVAEHEAAFDMGTDGKVVAEIEVGLDR